MPIADVFGMSGESEAAAALGQQLVFGKGKRQHDLLKTEKYKEWLGPVPGVEWPMERRVWPDYGY